MVKRKYLIFGMVGILGLTAAGVGLWHTYFRNGTPVDTQNLASNASGATGQPTVQNSYNLNVTQPSAGSSMALNAAPGSTSGTSKTDSSASPSTDSQAAKLLDPKTFGQYDQYKDNKTALFRDLQVGTGNTLSSGHKAAVYYRGWLTTGQLFDQSQTGTDGKLQSFVFTLGEHKVVAGWEEGLDGMKAGGVRLIIIPPAVGYGTQGQGPVPSNAVMVFQVQLLNVQ